KGRSRQPRARPRRLRPERKLTDLQRAARLPDHRDVLHRRHRRPFGDPWMLLTAAAVATSRIRQQRIVGGGPVEEEWAGLEGADERVGEAQRSGLAAGGGLDPPGGAVGAGEHAPAIGEKDHSLRGELDASWAALEQGDAELSLERLDLLAH